VRSERVGAKVRQVTLLNLGGSFGIVEGHWLELCRRIEEIVSGQVSLLGFCVELENAAQRYAGRLVVRGVPAVTGESGAVSGLETSVTLYDLTNTCFEGAVRGNGKAKRGHSKEKRSDCPLVTLGLVLDGSGFVRRSRVFAGSAVEARTLEGMLAGLGVPGGVLVILDRGIATEENVL
jgi:hypothetical protein